MSFDKLPPGVKPSDVAPEPEEEEDPRIDDKIEQRRLERMEE